MITLTTMQATALKINHRNFRFGIYPPEIKLVERQAEQALLRSMDSAGFVATYDSTRHGFKLCTRKGTIPSFCQACGFLPMDDARRIFSKQSDSYLR